MRRFRLTARAKCDLNDVWDHIAKDSMVAAEGILDEILERLRLLGRNPYLGRVRGDLSPSGMRSFPSGRYLILYRVEPPGVRVLRVVRGSRDLKGLAL